MASTGACLKRRHRSTVRLSEPVRLTFPLKTTPLARKSDCAVMGRKEEAHDSKTPCRGVDHRGVEGRPILRQCPGSLPEARHSDATLYLNEERIYSTIGEVTPMGFINTIKAGSMQHRSQRRWLWCNNREKVRADWIILMKKLSDPTQILS